MQQPRVVINSRNGCGFRQTETPLTARTIHLKYIWIPTLRQPQYFSPIPPDEVFIQLDSSPSGAGTLYDDPDARIWNVSLDLIQRNLYSTPIQVSPSWDGLQGKPLPFLLLG